MVMLRSEPLYRIWRRRIFHRRSIKGWVMFSVGTAWAAVGVWSTGEFTFGKLALMAPILSAFWGSVWGALSSVKPHWYQIALILSGLTWVAFVASRPERSEERHGETTEAQEWAAAEEQLSRYITELRLGNQAPTNPMDKLRLAQANSQRVFAAFFENRTPKGALAVKQAESDLLAAAQFVYTKPSPEYRSLFDTLLARLEESETQLKRTPRRL